MDTDKAVVSLEAWIMRPPDKPAGKRGFAAMTPERRKEIAAMGGAGVHPSNRSFAKNRKLAAEAGSKGGQASSNRGYKKKTPK